MARSTVLALLLVCALLAGVLAGAVHVIRGSRAELVSRFADQRLAQVTEAARIIDEDLENINDDLLVAGKLVRAAESSRDQRHELGALLAVVDQYKLVRVYDAAGERVAEVADPLGPLQAADASLERAMDDTARAALLRPPGDLEATPPMTAGGGWFRVFSTSLPRGGDHAPAPTSATAAGAVSILVDTEPLFSKLRLLASEPSSRLVVLGVYGHPIPVTDPALSAAAEAGDLPTALPRYHDLLERMRSGERGTLRLPDREAARLGLGRAEAVAVYASIRTRGGGRWSIATVSSTLPLRVQERELVLRLGLAAGAIGLGLVGFGAYVVAASRRAVALRERLRHAAHLAHLHEKTEKILDSIPTGVMALSDDGRIAAVNRALRERLPHAEIGADLASAFPDAPAAVTARLLGLIDAARASARVRSVHGERLALFGGEGQYSLHAVPLQAGFADLPSDLPSPDPPDPPAPPGAQADALRPEPRMLLVIEDVGEVHSLASQLLRAEKLATVGILAAGIAHEIGTPLGVVRGRAEYLLGKLGDPHPQAPAIRVMIDQIDVVTRTIRQLLDFSRVKPGLVQPVAVAPVARAVAELLRFEAERRKVSIELDVPDSLPAALADADQLQQVLVNLVMNACDACKPHGHVRVEARRLARADPEASPALLLAVEDDGCGIAPEHREQVFDPFFTTKKRGQGTGLGLTIAAQIVGNHGGQIELESDPGKGTRITILWPIADALAPRLATP